MYSQYEEEFHILQAFTKTDGRFLDIGAWNPKVFSNTRALAELGWFGLLIEPSPGPMIELLKEYGHDMSKFMLIQACVGLREGLTALHITDDAVSTSEDCEYVKWKDTAKYHGMMLSPTITLEQISNQFGGFDFINIDAEGVSVDLLIHMLGLGWRPKCICVEHNDRMPELMSSATPLYNVVYGNSTNLVLVRK